MNTAQQLINDYAAAIRRPIYQGSMEHRAAIAAEQGTADPYQQEIADTMREIVAGEDPYNIQGIHTPADILARLQSGHTWGRVETYRDGTLQYCAVVRADNRYIYWNHYGSSAEPATPQGMEFVLTHIFKMSPAEFIRSFVFVW